MNEPTSRRIAAYNAWLDEGERLIAQWFAAARAIPSEDAPPHTALGSILMTLRKIVDLRRILQSWEDGENGDKGGNFGDGDDAALLALLEEGVGSEEDPDDEDAMPD